MQIRNFFSIITIPPLTVKTRLLPAAGFVFVARSKLILITDLLQPIIYSGIITDKHKKK